MCKFLFKHSRKLERWIRDSCLFDDSWWCPNLRAPSTSCFLCCSATIAKSRGTTLQLFLLTEWKNRRARPALWYRFSTWTNSAGSIKIAHTITDIAKLMSSFKKKHKSWEKTKITCTYIVHRGAQSGQVVREEVSVCLSVASGNTSTLLWYRSKAACCTAMASHSDVSLAKSLRWSSASWSAEEAATLLASSASAIVRCRASMASRAWW